MKWSEQMRELISVDENFNQLKFNFNTQELLINEEVVAKTSINVIPDLATSSSYVVNYEDYNKIIKKYPFFKDVKFLLNCIFEGAIHFTKVSEIYYYDDYIVIQNFDSTRTLVIYTSPQE